MRQRRDGRASVRHDQGAHGSDALPDEDAAESSQRDGPQRAGLQSDARHEHRGHQAADDGAPGVRRPWLPPLGRSGFGQDAKNMFETIAWRHPHGRRSPKTPPARYHTTKTPSGNTAIDTESAAQRGG